MAINPEIPDGFVKNVIGYCDKISVLPREPITLKLSSYTPGPAHVSVVQLVSGDDRPHGTGFIEKIIEASLGDSIDVPFQPLALGSYGLVPSMPELSEGQFNVLVYPTLPREEPQTLVNMAGVKLYVTEHGFGVSSSSADMFIEVSVQSHRWYEASLEFGHPVTLKIKRLPSGSAEKLRVWTIIDDVDLRIGAGDWIFAASKAAKECFNGRLEAPSILTDGETVARWDFSLGIDSQEIKDSSEHGRDGLLFQTPTRGVRGACWDGTYQNYQDAPAQYAAIHFHEDDLTDAGWRDVVSWLVPKDLRSGQYAFKITQADSEEYVPFFVRAPKNRRGSGIAYLVPSATYLAYANIRLAFSGGLLGPTRVVDANQAFLSVHEDVGFSLYEHHADGSGVHFSSRLRPVLNFRPKTGTWAFNADTHITAWLDAIDQDFDVVTDEDLHLEGLNAIEGYRVLITGSHPEYYSTPMRNALSEWLEQSGRLMYLGGNGFYWRIAFCPENPAIIEVRRAEDGTRAWISNPGEYYQQFDGQYGGLWRRLGRAPNELVGIGFAAQGFDGGSYYKVREGSRDPRAAFIVAGIDQTEIWGDFGVQGGGAAGEEIDRWDESLGSPMHALILATSEDHNVGMLRVKEEFHMMHPLTKDSKVRADMTFCETPSGGAVFSVGSISYTGSLSHNNYDNVIETLTRNVLKRFNDAMPFDYPLDE
ncbi:MAG: N,N-dimethylformamidase beta subunit family domain-containing protein [Pseudomonadota bacterium]|nr:N,N-dimethylformamidase beta subunit family domain-containing protein [Pseudomonadota bacterium]